MNENLVIVESPTKEKILKEILGPKFQITSSKGHVKDLPESRLGIDVNHDFSPTWVLIPKQRQLIQNLKALSKEKERIFLATDPDREGEAISWHIARELKIEEKECRIEFNEITKDAVSTAILLPRKLNINVINSQIARRLLDRLVGYKVSPLCYKYTRGRSVGRVQSVAVHLIVKREKEIEAFKPEEFWKVNALLTKLEDSEKNSFEAILVFKNHKNIKITNEEQMNEICTEIRKNKFIVSEIINKKELKHPPFPFKTSTLQQTAYNKLNFSVKKTMRNAQDLYEGIQISGRGTTGLITYMRTDSTRISQEATSKARHYIESKLGKEYTSISKRSSKQKNSKTKIQDAHEAIRPTYVELEPDLIKNDLSVEQYKLYKLIWQFFIASQMKSAKLERTTITINSGDYIFEMNGTRILFPGFLKITGEGDIGKTVLPKIHQDEVLGLLKLIPKQSFTKPPARYNEASLVKILEKEGIGRPSTYGEIINIILSRGYVEREDKKLKPTNMGMVVDKFLVTYFSNIINVKFTAEMENDLDKIESGEQVWDRILDKFYQMLVKDIDHLEKNPPKELLEQSKIFSSERCDQCDSLMEIKSGRYGKYLACSKSPIDHPTKPYVVKLGIPCPLEGCEGEIIQRKSKKGRIFYGCNQYPSCSFYSMNLPVNKKCPLCGSILVEINRKTRGKIYQCSSKLCNYSEKVQANE